MQVAQHRPEVRQCTDTHKDYRWQETRLNQHIVDEVHDSQFVGNVVQRHFPDVLHYSVYHHHTILVRLNHAHISTGEVGKQHTESDGDKQQRFVLFLDTQIEQHERDGIHNQELRFGNDIAERSHVVQILKYLVHYLIFINTSSSETASPGLAQMAVTVPPNSARIAL